MINYLREKWIDVIAHLRRWWYSLFIVSTTFVQKSRMVSCSSVPIFSHIVLTTEDKRTITFTFKVDSRGLISNWFTKYIVEVIIDDSFTPEFRALNDKLLIAVTVFIINANYKSLANILLNKYLEYAYEDMKKTMEQAYEEMKKSMNKES